MKKVYLLLPFILLFLNAQAQQGSWDWGKAGLYTSNNGPVVQSEDYCTGADVDGNGYVTGPFWGNLTIDGVPLNNSSTDNQVVLIKYNSGGTLQWVAQSFSKTSTFFSNATSYDIATDNKDNVYITGSFGDTIIFNTDTLNLPAKYSEMFLLKYDKNGNVKWSKQPTVDFRGARSLGSAVTVDKSSNVYQAGVFTDTISIGSNKLTNKRDGLFIAKYDSSGNVIWATHSTLFTYGDTYLGNPTGPYSITTDKFNNLYVTGLFSDTLTYGGASLYNSPVGNQSVFLLKVDSNGNLKWLRQGLNDSSFETGPVNVATDNSGDAYCAGTYAGVASFGSINLPTSLPNTNFFMVKFDTAGNPLWVKTTNNSKHVGNWVATKLVSDKNNHLYIGGYGNGDTLTYNSTAVVASGASFGDGYSVILKIDTAGNLLCSSILPGAGDDFNGIAVDTSGNYVYLGGDVAEQLIVGPDTVHVTSFIGPNETPFLARWQPCSGCLLNLSINPPSDTLCLGQSVSLNANGGTSYTWSPAIGLNTTSGSSVTANPTITTTYTLVGTSSSCSNTTYVTIAVASTINMSVTSSSACNGDSAQLTASGAQHYTWSPATGLSATTGDTVLAAPTLTTTYTVIGMSNGCSETALAVMTVQQPPNKPIITQSVTGDTLFSSARNGDQWYVNGQAITGATDSFYVIQGLPVGDSIKVQVTDIANGCSNVSSAFVTGINQLSVNSEQLLVYPNPSTGLVTISSTQSISDITVTNLVGQVIYTAKPKQILFNFELRNEGMYFVTIKSGDEIVTKKLVVSK